MSQKKTSDLVQLSEQELNTQELDQVVAGFTLVEQRVRVRSICTSHPILASSCIRPVDVSKFADNK